MSDLVHIPKNFFVKDVFVNGMPEKHEYEQYFWTTTTVEKIMKACEYQFVEETCCLTTPSLAHQWNTIGRDEVLLDIDKRFNYLPKYKYYDVRNPTDIEGSFKLLVLDLPFFSVSVKDFRKAVDVITGKNYNTKIMIGFIKREEKQLIEAFKEYDIKLTNCPLEYASIKPNKWANFGLYSNVDLAGIKRLKN
jgi:hypothetical protein